LDKLEISFIEFNSIIGNNANEKLIDQVNSRLDDILSKMTESVQQEENSRSEEPILRNSQLNIEAEEFADNLYKKLYKNK
jgi:nitrogenase molybdenum-iron protein alpha/beta subunit